ncbi:MAG TPA: EamA family transporter [Mycobacteriales bacterium]|nr:EamA family transporter [Mycobacteriales bacterium]
MFGASVRAPGARVAGIPAGARLEIAPDTAPVRAPPEGPSGLDLVLLVVAVLAVSTSGPLIAATAAPALAIAFWRSALAAAVLAPATLLTARREVAALGRREWMLALLAGALLAAHFATWVPSVVLTSVASATALVATQPAWAALIARARGEDVPGRAWAGIGLAVAGVGLLSGVDLTVSARALAGDALALAGGGFAAGYVVAGGAVRRTVSTTTYTTVCYATAALLLLAGCLAARVGLTGYTGETWLKLAALTAGAQLLGHSLVNRVLRTTSPTLVSLAILFEVPGAALVAAVWLGQSPPAAALPAAALLVAGVALVVTARRGVPAATPAE